MTRDRFAFPIRIAEPGHEASRNEGRLALCSFLSARIFDAASNLT